MIGLGSDKNDKIKTEYCNKLKLTEVTIMSRVQELDIDNDDEIKQRLPIWLAEVANVSLPYLPLERWAMVSNSDNDKRRLAMVSRNRRNVKCATCATPSFMELLLAAVCKTWKCDRGKNMRLTKGQFSPRPLQCCRGEKCPELCLNNRRSCSPPTPDRQIRSCLRMNKGSPFHIDTSLCKTEC